VIQIDPDVFTHQPDLDYSNETFVVTDTDQTEAVVAALHSAARRFMRVDESGVEHADDATAQAAFESGLYTPNYCSDPEITEDGVQMYLDCKGAIEDPMARTLRDVLHQELEDAGIDARVRAVTYH
jgi:carboxypeptidase C (cathepsin A)